MALIHRIVSCRARIAWHALTRSVTSGLLVWLSFASTAFAEQLSGRVIGVTDGDTVTLLDSANRQYKIRLAGIDAPEKRQAFGNLSRQYLADMVFQKNVVADLYKTDRYGRVVATLLLAGQDVNLRQLQAGMAWSFKKYEREQPEEERERYSLAEDAERWAVVSGTTPRRCLLGSFAPLAHTGSCRSAY